MPYGKTLPIEHICPETGVKIAPMRANKKMEKLTIKKYSRQARKHVEVKPKVCKHSN